MNTRTPSQAGYSLLEVMISMVVLGIAFLALIATQLGTLNGYISARDELAAAEIGRRTTDILRAQGSQWRGPGTTSFAPVDPYDTGGPIPFDVQNPVAQIVTAPNTWFPLYTDPIDIRLNRENAVIDEAHIGGKYCVYARGGEVAPYSAFLSGNPAVAAIRVQVAVVYPGPNAVLTDCTTVSGTDLDDVGDPTADPFEPPGLETVGLRVSYFGTMLVRHTHLEP